MNGRDRGAVLGGSGNSKVAVARDFECEPILHFVRLSFLSIVSSDVEATLKEITVDPKMVSGAITLNGTSPAPTLRRVVGDSGSERRHRVDPSKQNHLFTPGASLSAV
jgi:hypothetical protein